MTPYGFSHHGVHPLTQSSSSVPCHSTFNFLWKPEPYSFPGRLECYAYPNLSTVQAGIRHSSRVPYSSHWCSDLENSAQKSRRSLPKVTHFSHTMPFGRCPIQSQLGWKVVNYCTYCFGWWMLLPLPVSSEKATRTGTHYHWTHSYTHHR